jgi:hypothetical protein
MVHAWIGSVLVALGASSSPAPFTLTWEDNLLSISRTDLPGKRLDVWYIEAFCRADAHEADWGDTVIPHKTELVRRDPSGAELELRSILADGVIAEHRITAESEAVRFTVRLQNPTDTPSEAVWAQPCIRVGDFTGLGDPDNSRTYDYLAKSFVFLDGQLRFMPTSPWNTEARYTPGQVWRAPEVPGKDVNPRPLNPKATSNGLIGCISKDERWIMATAWEPYHELFQGVITCLHSDFHIGGLKPGETKEVRGVIYLFEGDREELLRQYHRDFPSHVESHAGAEKP